MVTYNEHVAEFFSADLGPTSAQECFFFGFFGFFDNFVFFLFFLKICARSERCRNLMVGIFEVQTSFGNIAFPLSPVLVEVEAEGGLDA